MESTEDIKDIKAEIKEECEDDLVSTRSIYTQISSEIKIEDVEEECTKYESDCTRPFDQLAEIYLKLPETGRNDDPDLPSSIIRGSPEFSTGCIFIYNNGAFMEKTVNSEDSRRV
ncbi:uncharacterized protein [Diabrotica undecimpunctata]|uniref:uncharacterized protein isoform X2 n=1 Tax=Diabrotica undecimpunctata TaxID=50387 RepID=UPI003B63C148